MGHITPDILCACADSGDENPANLQKLSRQFETDLREQCIPSECFFCCVCKFPLLRSLFGQSYKICLTIFKLNNLRITKHTRRLRAKLILNFKVCIFRGDYSRYIELRLGYQLGIFRTSIFQQNVKAVQILCKNMNQNKSYQRLCKCHITFFQVF